MKIAPHIPIVSEENKQLPYEIRKNYQYCWCVDPLDGTKEFIKRNGQFTVNIALIRGDTPVLGVVHVPVWGSTYWAMETAGAYLREPQKAERRLEAAVFDAEAAGLTVVASASHLSQETKDFVALLKEPKFSQLGSSLKLLMVAEGKAHVYPRLAPTCEWDTAASHVIVTQAGGSVVQAGRCDNKGKAMEDWKTELAKDVSVKYNKPDPLNPFFVVYGKRPTPQTEQAAQS